MSPSLDDIDVRAANDDKAILVMWNVSKRRKKRGRNAHHVIVLATNWLIVAGGIEAHKGRTIRAPKFVRILDRVDEEAQSKEVERVELGTLMRLKQRISN